MHGTPLLSSKEDHIIDEEDSSPQVLLKHQQGAPQHQYLQPNAGQFMVCCFLSLKIVLFWARNQSKLFFEFQQELPFFKRDQRPKGKLFWSHENEVKSERDFLTGDFLPFLQQLLLVVVAFRESKQKKLGYHSKLKLRPPQKSPWGTQREWKRPRRKKCCKKGGKIQNDNPAFGPGRQVLAWEMKKSFTSHKTGFMLAE